ncbi:MAG: bifunctional precorrin-2 dehydrogenase/sirohydrochlorin ferrochelatase [Sulfurovum sp.]|nr:bifunctional precorrin-2 dehydrogenase/sirohydrochlorin ferrochelatase [Sulfurovum sp.]
MAYFPMYIDMNDAKVLVVGAGKIAREKLGKLIDFTDNITVIAPHVDVKVQKLIETYHLKLEKKEYEVGDIKSFDIVIVAASEEVQKNIYEESRGSNILVNSVDNKSYCDFIFPSYIQKGDLTIAFSTGGASPAFSKRIRKYVDSLLPESIETFLNKLKSERISLVKGKERMEYFEKEVELYFSKHFK